MLDNILVLLGISKGDADEALLSKLNLIVLSVTERLKNLIGGITPPETLNYIIMEVSVSRFNRIGSEGLSSHSLDGESLSFTDNDFAPYMDEIQTYREQTVKDSTGKVRFL